MLFQHSALASFPFAVISAAGCQLTKYLKLKAPLHEWVCQMKCSTHDLLLCEYRTSFTEDGRHGIFEWAVAGGRFMAISLYFESVHNNGRESRKKTTFPAGGGIGESQVARQVFIPLHWHLWLILRMKQSSCKWKYCVQLGKHMHMHEEFCFVFGMCLQIKNVKVRARSTDIIRGFANQGLLK